MTTPTFDPTPFLDRDEDQHYDRKSLYEGPPGAKVSRDRRAVRDQVAEYVAAFANAEGGVLILGLEDDGSVTGHNLPPRAVKALLEVPRERLDPPLKPGLEVEHQGKRLLVYEVPVAFAPVQVVGGGFPLRMADQTVAASPDQIKALKFTGLAESFEARPSTKSLAELDTELLDRAKANAGLAALSHQDYLLQRRLADWRGATLQLRQAAELLFAGDMVEHPNAGVRVFLVVGSERKLGRDHNVEELPRIEGSLPRVIEQAHEAVSARLRRPSRLDDDAIFRPVCEYPDFAWREAILNAVAHRDYGVQGFGVEVWLFDDRMEVSSPGGLLPAVSIPRLLTGERTHISRNPRIVRCLVDLGLMRDAGEGILRMHAKMEEQRLPAPEFDSSTHRMVVKLRNRGESASDRRELEPDRRELEPDRRELKHFRRELQGEDEGLTEEEQRLVADLGARPRREKLWIAILVLLRRRPWQPVELARALNNRNVRRLAEQHLTPMLEAGLIRRTQPEKPTAPDQAYYAAEGYYGPPVGGAGEE